MNLPTFETLPQFFDRGDVEPCRVFLDSVHAESADDPVYLSFRAELLRRTGDMAQSLAACLDISRRFPGFSRHRYTMADVAAHLGEVDAVLPALESLAAPLVPRLATQLRAEALHALGRDQEVVALRPLVDGGDMSGRVSVMHIAQSEMRLHGIAAGLRDYASAWTTPEALRPMYGLDEGTIGGYWWGRSALPARLTLERRGGIGDYFLWSRYVPLLEVQGTQVLHNSGVATLMRPLPFANSNSTPPWQHPTPAPRPHMWSDAFTLFTSLFPHYGYGRAQTYLAAPWSERAGAIVRAARARAKGRPCGALFWSANESAGNFALKSACLHHVLPLLEMQDVHWVVIQRGHQMKLWMEHPDHDSATNVTEPLSVDDMASLLTQLDGSVVVDSAVAHIAAALGKPTWMLASQAACWRFERHAHRTPWFETMELFRQPTLGDWQGAVQAVASGLRRQAAQGWG